MKRDGHPISIYTIWSEVQTWTRTMKHSIQIIEGYAQSSRSQQLMYMQYMDHF
jgi:hypothetical protein